MIIQSEKLFFQLVIEELERARSKFPENEKNLAALSEEAGEVVKAMLDYGPGSKELVQECVQVASMALRVAIEGDSDFDGWIGYKKR